MGNDVTAVCLLTEFCKFRFLDLIKVLLTFVFDAHI